MRIIAYTYEADYHCVACAVKRFGVSAEAAIKLPMTVDLDSNSIPYAATDREGNNACPIFSTDSKPDYEPTCGDCHAPIEF